METKTKKLFTTIAILSSILMAGCDKSTIDPVSSESNPNAYPQGSMAKNSNGFVSSYSILAGSLQAPVLLGSAGNFVILSKSGITDVYESTITGNVGSSPITGAAILVTCSEVAGTIYSVDAAGPLPCTVNNATLLTASVGDMLTAYNDAAGRINPDFLNLGAGNIGGLTLTHGLYKWTSTLIIPTDVTISGGPDDVFIFQVDGTLTMSSAVRITLIGGVQAKNIFWQTAGAVTFGTTSHFEGNILGKTGINLQTGATMNGRMLAQTAVTLQMNTVTQPQ